jgi:hypothetical protein
VENIWILLLFPPVYLKKNNNFSARCVQSPWIISGSLYNRKLSRNVTSGIGIGGEIGIRD